MVNSLVQLYNDLRRASYLVLALLSLITRSAYGLSPTIKVQTNPAAPNYGQVRLDISAAIMDCQLDQALYREILSIYALDDVPEDQSFPQVAGHYWHEANALIFTPKYPPPPGLKFTVSFDHLEINKRCSLTLSKSLVHTFQFLIEEKRPSTSIEGVYPSSNYLPANLLRFYIHFSKPMGSKNPYQFLRLIDGDGQVLRDPFVVVPEGLWDDGNTRLTVFIHPGRIKRGVGPRMTMGRVFEPGKSYTLEIDSVWADANGLSLLNPFRKTFTIHGAIRKTVQIAQWGVHLPVGGTIEPLIIKFKEVMDSALSSRLINVMGLNGTPILGKSVLKNKEMEWHFIPDAPWVKGSYSISVNTKLEDVSGNNLQHAFDVKLGPGSIQPQDTQKEFEQISIRIE